MSNIKLVSDRNECHVRGGNEHPQWLEVGDLIKVRHGGERFWCIIRGVSDSGHVIAQVNNNLIFDHPFASDDIIEVRLELQDGMLVWVPA